MSINISNISFGYELQKMVLHNISFDLEKGKTLAIVGASGCGKSTLLRMISGILPCTNDKQKLHGTILIDNLTPDQYRKTGKLAFMFQEATLMPHLTVKENIAFPLKIAKKENDDEVQGLMQMVGLSDYANYLPKQLSGGMKTRVALARSFSTNPELLLLDEPFSALDIAWKSKLYVELEKLKKQNNTTVIIVTHDIQEALLLCDKVIVLKSNGTINGELIPIRSKLSIEKRVEDISGFLSDVYTRHYIPIQDLIIKDGRRGNVTSNEANTLLENLIAISGNIDNEKNFTFGSHIEIRKISQQKETNAKLLDAYSKAKTDTFKHELLWDILNYPDLPIEKHYEFSAFYIKNINDFSAKTLQFFAEKPNNVFNVLKNRIGDFTIPNSKKWIYLCDIYASSENERVLKYLEDVINGKIEQLNYPLAKEVAKQVIAKIKNEKQDTPYIA